MGLNRPIFGIIVASIPIPIPMAVPTLGTTGGITTLSITPSPLSSQAPLPLSNSFSILSVGILGSHFFIGIDTKTGLDDPSSWLTTTENSLEPLEPLEPLEFLGLAPLSSFNSNGGGTNFDGPGPIVIVDCRWRLCSSKPGAGCGRLGACRLGKLGR